MAEDVPIEGEVVVDHKISIRKLREILAKFPDQDMAVYLRDSEYGAQGLEEGDVYVARPESWRDPNEHPEVLIIG